MSIKFLVKVSAALVTFVVLIFLYFRNVRRANKIRKSAERLENDWSFARQLVDSTNDLIAEIPCEMASLRLKLDRLIYEIDIQDHHLIKCHKFDDHTYLLITSYEHLNTANPNGVEKLVQINYKFILDKIINKVMIYSDRGFFTTYDVRKIFIKGFFKKIVGIDPE